MKLLSSKLHTKNASLLKTRDYRLMSNSGVTLIEMLIVVAIIAVVSAVLMFNYSDFSTNVSVRNLSQEIALAVRKSQTYATSVRAIEGTQSLSSSTFPGYGIVFSTDDPSLSSSSITPNAKRFVIFADVADGISVPDHLYGADMNDRCGSPSSQTNECIETFTISSADKVVAICTNTTQIDACTGTGTLAISFNRPSPDAHIMYNGTSVAYAQIVLQSAKGLKRSIIVWNTGQVSVQ